MTRCSGRLRGLFRPHLATFVSFGAIQTAQLLLPLLALPWLARVLGPDAFGLLMYMSLVSVIIGLVMDWGFTLGAVREAAACRGREGALSALLGQVLSAKILLSSGCLLGSLALLPLLPHAAAHPGAYALAVMAGLARGLNPTWFFQGIGRAMRRMACWDVCSSALVLLLAFACVRAADDWPRYLLLTACCKGFAYLWLTARLAGRYRVLPTLGGGWRALARTRMLFAGTLASLVYNNGAQLLLGFFLPPAQMGMLVAADKIVRAVVSVSNPVTQTLFPEICALRGAQPGRAASMLRWSLGGTAAVMLCATAAVWFAAPWLIRLALGAAYAEATPILRIMAFLAPVLACNMVLGTQTLVAFGKERALIATQAVMCVLSLPMAAILAYVWGVEGGACLSLLVESGIFGGLSWSVLRFCPIAFFAPATKGAR
ncbi:lipopolysaccharide biosynthesis protein [Desulfovibrio sp. SGI.169]|uniref:lipopolysaccharide biosynthesis protein n=1 Tax=Desulfovibrio sp. SGI.169 TaxID=3420561 RepID=UPI003CFC3B28